MEQPKFSENLRDSPSNFEQVDLQMFSLMDQMENSMKAAQLIKFSDFRKSTQIITVRGNQTDDLSKSKSK